MNSLLIGDSLAVGLKPYLRATNSLAVAGTTVQYWSDSKGQIQLQRALLSKPDVVFVSLGTNDAYNGNSYQSTATSSTRKLVTQILDSGSSVVWISPPSLPNQYGSNTLSRSVIDAIKNVVSSLGGKWLDSTSLVIQRSPDKLHPTNDGYLGWADSILSSVSGSSTKSSNWILWASLGIGVWILYKTVHIQPGRKLQRA